jgi:nucleotide-binding universal stress UspA family protein
MSRIRRVMHASDFSPASRAAFAEAVEMAETNRAELVVVHVLTPVMPVAGEGMIPPQTWEDIERSARASAQKSLGALLAKAKKAGVRARGVLLDGVPHEAIVRAVKSQRPNVLVMGTHGRTGLAKFLLGSVTSRVVALSPCPVLTVRGK